MLKIPTQPWYQVCFIQQSKPQRLLATTEVMPPLNRQVAPFSCSWPATLTPTTSSPCRRCSSSLWRWFFRLPSCWFLARGWWFGTCFFPYVGNTHPNWLPYFFVTFGCRTEYDGPYVGKKILQCRQPLPWFTALVAALEGESKIFSES